MGYIIGHLKTNAPHFICHPVRILPDLTDAVLAILLVDFCCIGRAYSIALQKYHHILDVFLLLPTFLNLGKALFADTRHFQQFFDVVLNDFQCLETELFDDEFGILGADTFHQTAAQVAFDAVERRGHDFRPGVRYKLVAVFLVYFPFAFTQQYRTCR
ncbi:uncharacterized protein BN805_01822 [Prevotella sp. CAG:891]|nr:uncharacterized protein BN805_01822 [Prevotella sp. CAG:891]